MEQVNRAFHLVRALEQSRAGVVMDGRLHAMIASISAPMANKDLGFMFSPSSKFMLGSQMPEGPTVFLKIPILSISNSTTSPEFNHGP